MSDTLGLGAAIRGGSVLDALAHPATVNPLGAYAGAAATADRIWQTLQWQAQQAMGEAYQGAIDPATGRYDPQKFNSLLAASPQAALAAKAGVESSTT